MPIKEVNQCVQMTGERLIGWGWCQGALNFAPLARLARTTTLEHRLKLIRILHNALELGLVYVVLCGKVHMAAR